MKLRIHHLLWALVTLALAGCASEEERSAKNGDDPPPLMGATGVMLTKVAIYQGLERALMQDGLPLESTVPLVQGRSAMVRIFYTTDAGYDGEPVTARLKLAGQDPIDGEHVLMPLSSSVDEDLASTVNIDVPGERIGEVFDYRVSLLQEREEGDELPAAHYPSADATEPVFVDGPQNTLRVILAPFAYNYDGSGRVPDLSPESVESFRQLFVGIYPVSDVEISVREVEPWSGRLGADGSGWQDLGITVYGFRNADDAPDDVYYYGIFNPKDTFYQYCGSGCLLGVTMLNNSPPDTGTVSLRMAIGVGFPQVAADTCAHEIGHAHGLEHAPCGYGLDPSSIDYDYPYDEGEIGVWGYNPFGPMLLAPDDATDIMGYCDDQWISDYHYAKLLNRGRNVNLPDWHGPAGGPQSYELITVEGRGKATFQKTVESRRPLSGRAVDVRVRTAGGALETRLGQYFAYDHLPGGWLFLPPGAAEWARAEFVIDGTVTVATR